MGPFKLPFHSQLINFIQKYFKKLAYIYNTNKRFSWRNLCWVWAKLRHNISFPTFKLSACTKCFMAPPLYISFDKFGIWLLGYRIEFSCLYIPQWHSFISTLWLWSTDEYLLFFLDSERKSSFKQIIQKSIIEQI